MARGYFGIGVFHPKTDINIGTLLRSAHAFGAAFVFTVGRRYKKQSSDVWHSSKHIPLYHYARIEQLKKYLPHGCPLVGVELDDVACPLGSYSHPERACYLLGAEDHGLPSAVRAECHGLVAIEGAAMCLNVASAGSIVLWDRTHRRARRENGGGSNG
jgi:tRNA G18 (ribose-2'-O)-methylase SpoU